LSWKFVSRNTLISFASGIKQVSIYQPGIIFIIASIGVLFVLNKGHFGKHFLSLIKVSLVKIWLPAVTILLLICFTELITKSLSENISSLTASMNQTGQIMVQPIIGIFGSFITGSATMSNLLFVGSLSTVALAQQPLFMSLLHTGGAIGNAISLQNIVMVKSIVPGYISEANVLRFNLPVVGIYVVLVFVSVLIYMI